jgi:hypothetical protein
LLPTTVPADDTLVSSVPWALIVWLWKRMSWTITCDPLPEAATGTMAIVWPTPLVRLNEKPIGSGEVTLTGIGPVIATPST